MSLTVSTAQHQELATKIVVGGSLDSDTAPTLLAHLEDVLRSSPRALVFDMAGLDFISSAGLRVIFKAQKALEANGGEVAMINLKPQVAKVFEIVKALPSLSIFASPEEMDDYLQSIQSRTAGQSGH